MADYITLDPRATAVSRERSARERRAEAWMQVQHASAAAREAGEHRDDALLDAELTTIRRHQVQARKMARDARVASRAARDAAQDAIRLAAQSAGAARRPGAVQEVIDRADTIAEQAEEAQELAVEAAGHATRANLAVETIDAHLDVALMHANVDAAVREATAGQ